MSQTKEDDSPEFYPLATNILKLQYYSGFFDLTEIVMFDWFVVKAKAFKHKQFYYARRRICEEVRIKEDRLVTILKRFAMLGIIDIEIKGMPKQHYFEVDFKEIIALIPYIFQFAENSKLLPGYGKLLAFFSKLLAESSKEKKYNKEANKGGISNPKNGKEENMVAGEPATAPSSSNDDSQDDKEKQKQLRTQAAEKKRQEAESKAAEFEAKANEEQTRNMMNFLNKLYAERLTMYNKDKQKGERIKTVTKLSFTASDKKALLDLSVQYDKESIENSFIAYVDEFLDDNPAEVRKLIPFFLARKPKTKDFDTFHTYLNRFIARYARVKT